MSLLRFKARVKGRYDHEMDLIINGKVVVTFHYDVIKQKGMKAELYVLTDGYPDDEQLIAVVNGLAYLAHQRAAGQL